MDMNALEIPNQLNGQEVAFAGFVGRDCFVVITKEKAAFVIEVDYNEEDDEHEMKILSKGYLYNKLRGNLSLQKVFKKHGVLDWKAYLEEMERLNAKQAESAAQEALEKEKALYLELKRKYEPPVSEV